MLNPRLIFTGMILGTALTGWTSAFGQGAEGHGGYVKDVNGTKRLLELVTKYKCDPTPIDEILKNIPDLESSLEKIALVDWYFAQDLRKEIQKLDFCLTNADLRTGNPFDVRGPLSTASMDYLKIARIGVRDGYKVYASRPLMASLTTPGDQAKFIIHEAVHSYFPADPICFETAKYDEDPRCWDKLQTRKVRFYSFLSDLSEVIDGKLSASQFHYRMGPHGFEAQFPTTSEDLLPYRAEVEFLLSSSEDRKAAVLNAVEPEILVKDEISKFNDFLAPWDRQYRPALSTLEHTLTEIISEGSIDDLRNVLGKKYTKINVSSTAWAMIDSLSQPKQDVLLASADFKAFTEMNYAALEKMRIKQGPLYLIADRNLQELGRDTAISDEVEFTALHRRSHPLSSEAKLPPSIRSTASIIRKLIKKDAIDEIKALFTENEHFYHAIGLKELFKQLPQMSFYFQFERKLAEDVLTKVRDGLIESTIREVSRGLTPEETTTFRSLIHFEKFKN